ncbi:MAG: N-formylglutamate amidohydrolase, partial [Hyphomicrobiales bacterium]|nr:N-formylglutamate amidohydrolase [Hyphomicrobiales bacterium]
NRGADDPTLVMRISDGALIPGNAHVEAREIERRRQLFWGPYRAQIDSTIEAMLATGEPPAILSIHSFTPLWRGVPRPWKVGVLWDSDPRLPEPLLQALAQEEDLAADEIGDNEPYEGALFGDTINAVATSRELSSALIEVRQDLIADQESAEAWADRLARIMAPLIAAQATRAPENRGSRTCGGGPAPRRDKTPA